MHQQAPQVGDTVFFVDNKHITLTPRENAAYQTAQAFDHMLPHQALRHIMDERALAGEKTKTVPLAAPVASRKRFFGLF